VPSANIIPNSDDRILADSNVNSYATSRNLPSSTLTPSVSCFDAMNDSKRIEEEKPKPDLTGIVPKWVVDMSKDMHSLADIEKIDDMVFTMPPAKLKDMHSRLDMNAFAKFMEQQLEANKSSPIRLTSMLRINGKPFTLSKHRFFEPLFYPDLPDRTLLVCARQVGKSTHTAAQGVLQAAAINRFKVLFMAPQFEQIRRFSHQYVRQFVKESYLTPMLLDDNCIDSVLHKTFKNGSEIWFSFALLSVDRIRGLAVDGIRIDEVQDLNPEFLDIVRECMSASEKRSEMYAGTSKTIDNLIEQLRLQSSQAEWFIRCETCNHWNIPTVEGSGPGLGVMEMIQPEGMCCAKCKRLINPEKGQWVHKYPDKVQLFPSYHVPQVIAPVHYANQKNWRQLLLKRQLMPTATFINEVLGEACDEGQRLVSRTELEAVCVLPANSKDRTADTHRYTDRILGVDWGGKGSKFQSLTAAAVACYAPGTNKVDIIFGHLFQAMMDPVIETKEVLKIANDFHCTGIAHDVAVAGELRLSIMRDLGVPDERMINCRYAGTMAMKSMIQFVPPTDNNPNSYYNMDKSKIITAICLGIKNRNIRFPQFDSMSDAAGDNMIMHFLSVYEETSESIFGGEKRFIKRNPGMPDDFLHAVCFAVISMWRRYPELVPNLVEEVVSDAEPASFSNPTTYHFDPLD
jgi:hypothetical protein